MKDEFGHESVGEMLTCPNCGKAAPTPTEGATVGHVHYEPCYDSEYECALHKAAPQMREALERFVRLCPSEEGLGGHAPMGAFNVAAVYARVALAAADGKGER